MLYVQDIKYPKFQEPEKNSNDKFDGANKICIVQWRSNSSYL